MEVGDDVMPIYFHQRRRVAWTLRASLDTVIRGLAGGDASKANANMTGDVTVQVLAGKRNCWSRAPRLPIIRP